MTKPKKAPKLIYVVTVDGQLGGMFDDAVDAHKFGVVHYGDDAYGVVTYERIDK